MNDDCLQSWLISRPVIDGGGEQQGSAASVRTLDQRSFGQYLPPGREKPVREIQRFCLRERMSDVSFQGIAVGHPETGGGLQWVDGCQTIS